MLKHIVIYKLKDNSEQQRHDLRAKFLSMKGVIPELVNIEAGANVIESERAFDFALVCDFESQKQLDEYLVHPYHVEVRNYVRSVICASHSVDFII